MLKRIPILLFVTGLSGCAITQPQPAEDMPQVSINTTDNPGQIPFTEEDVKPFTPMPKSAGMERRLDMKLHNLEAQLEEVERQRHELNRLIIESENTYKPLRQNATDQQVRKYRAAQRAHQEKIAQLNAQLEVQTAEIENRLEETLAQLENHYAYQKAKLDAEHRLKRTQQTVRARAEKAKLTATNEMLEAGQTEPVLDDGVAYYDLASEGADHPQRKGGAPDSSAAPGPKRNDQAAEVTSRPASPPGSSNPDFPEQLAPAHANEDSIVVRDGGSMRIKYDAVLVYHEKETRDLWTNYLRAYGETELFESRSEEDGEYYIYLGTFNDPSRAERRLSDVEETIGSKINSRIVTRDLSRG